MRSAAIVAALVLTACSGTGEDGQGNGGRAAAAVEADGIAVAGAKACDVLDKASVDSVMGRDMGAPASNTDTMCQYMWSGEKLADQAMATLTIHGVPLGALEPGLKEMNAVITPVSGIGERAFWAEGYGLYVEHGGRSGIYVAGQGVGESERAANVAKTEALAKATAGKL